MLLLRADIRSIRKVSCAKIGFYLQMVVILLCKAPRFNTPHTHGTGCTFSACLTAELAKGEPLQSAVKQRKILLPLRFLTH